MKASTSETASEQTPKQQLSILIVDDETPMLELMSAMLQSFGHTVVARATSGEEAVRLARELRPDLIILDVGMPGMDGVTAAEQILSERSVPIIIETGIAQEEAIDRASKLDIQSYLIKPFRKEQLQTSVRLAMVRHHKTQSAKQKIAELKGEIEVGKIVNRAVELLIGKFGIDRAEAMEKLEAAAQARSCSITDAAKAISATLG